MARDSRGRFAPGNKIGKGRPVGSGKQHVKEMTWDALTRVVRLLFTMPEGELVEWISENRNSLSRAELVFLKNENSQDLKHLNGLLDRVIGKATYAEPETEGGDDDLLDALEILEAEEMGDVIEMYEEEEIEEAKEVKKLSPPSMPKALKEKKVKTPEQKKKKEAARNKRKLQRKINKGNKNVRRRK